MKMIKYTLSALLFTALAGSAYSQSFGLAGFETSEGYQAGTQLNQLANSRWTKSGQNGLSGAAYTYSGANVLRRDGTKPSNNQLLDTWGSAGNYSYQFDSTDFGAAPVNYANGEIRVSLWFCPDTNGDVAFDTNPFQTMAFYDSSGQKILGLGTGNASVTNELAVWKSLDGVSYAEDSSVTANSHAWNRWDITFNLSETGPDKVSVDLIRGYGLAPGTAQSVDAAVSLYDNATLGVNVDYVSSMTLGRAGYGGAKYYYDDFSITTVPEPSSIALLSLGGLALVFRRRK